MRKQQQKCFSFFFFYITGHYIYITGHITGV